MKYHLQPSTSLYLHYFRCRRNVQNWYNRNKQLNEEVLTQKKHRIFTTFYHLFFFGGYLHLPPNNDNKWTPPTPSIRRCSPKGKLPCLPAKRWSPTRRCACSPPGLVRGGWLPGEFAPFVGMVSEAVTRHQK